MVAFFIHLKAAFDSADRRILMKKGIREGLIDAEDGKARRLNK